MASITQQGPPGFPCGRAQPCPILDTLLPDNHPPRPMKRFPGRMALGRGENAVWSPLVAQVCGPNLPAWCAYLPAWEGKEGKEAVSVGPALPRCPLGPYL